MIVPRATALISSDADIFTFINTFHVKPGNQDALAQSLKRFTEEASANMPGFVAVAVHVSEDGNRVINYVQWRSAQAMDAMRATPAFRQHMAEVAALSDRIEPLVLRLAYVRSAT